MATSLSQCVDFLAEKMVVGSRQQVFILNCLSTVNLYVLAITFET